MLHLLVISVYLWPAGSRRHVEWVRNRM